MLTTGGPHEGASGNMARTKWCSTLVNLAFCQLWTLDVVSRTSRCNMFLQHVGCVTGRGVTNFLALLPPTTLFQENMNAGCQCREINWLQTLLQPLTLRHKLLHRIWFFLNSPDNCADAPRKCKCHGQSDDLFVNPPLFFDPAPFC